MTQDKGWGGPSSDGPEGGGEGRREVEGPEVGRPEARGPGSPPYAPNAPYGWGAWGPATLPPKPGVIPLGPLDLGDIFNGAFATVRRYWKQLFGVAGVVFGASAVILVVTVAIAYVLVGDHLHTLSDLPADTNPPWDDLRPLLIAFGCVWLVTMLLVTGSSVMTQTASSVIVQNAVLGRPVTFREVWRRASARVPAVLGTLVLSSLMVFLPLLLVVVGVSVSVALWRDVWLIPVGILGFLGVGVAGIWLWVQLSLAGAITVIERQGPVMSLRRSFRLVRGSWWRVFGISLLGYLVANTVIYGIGYAAQFFTAFGPGSMTDLGSDTPPGEVFSSLLGFYATIMIAQLIGEITATVFTPVITGLIYLDRRIRTEDLAPALIATARTEGRLDPSGPGPAF